MVLVVYCLLFLVVLYIPLVWFGLVGCFCFVGVRFYCLFVVLLIWLLSFVVFV